METASVESEKDQAVKPQKVRKPLPQWFKPGQSGNPHGRPKGKISLKQSIIDQLTPETAYNIVEAFIKKAVEGDTASLKLIAELLGEIGQKTPAVQIAITAVSDPNVLERARQYAQINNELINKDNQSDVIQAEVIENKLLNTEISGSTAGGQI